MNEEQYKEFLREKEKIERIKKRYKEVLRNTIKVLVEVNEQLYELDSKLMRNTVIKKDRAVN